MSKFTKHKTSWVTNQWLAQVQISERKTGKSASRQLSDALDKLKITFKPNNPQPKEKK